MSLPIQLVTMTELDLDWAFQVEVSVYPFPWSKNGFLQALDRGLNYVFVNQQNEPVGYVCLLPVLEQVEILNFCIAPSHQGQGYGSEAMNRLIEKLGSDKFDKVLLEVRVSNQSAINLYHKHGFEKDGVRPNYYRNAGQSSEDAVLMSLSI